MFCIFVLLFCWHGGSLTHNEDIVTFRCGGGEPCFTFKKNVKKKILFIIGGVFMYICVLLLLFRCDFVFRLFMLVVFGFFLLVLWFFHS